MVPRCVTVWLKHFSNAELFQLTFTIIEAFIFNLKRKYIQNMFPFRTERETSMDCTTIGISRYVPFSHQTASTGSNSIITSKSENAKKIDMFPFPDNPFNRLCVLYTIDYIMITHLIIF